MRRTEYLTQQLQEDTLAKNDTAKKQQHYPNKKGNAFSVEEVTNRFHVRLQKAESIAQEAKSEAASLREVAARQVSDS